MKFHYYPETDSLYIELTENPSADSRELQPGIVLDLDAEGNLVGLDIDHASKVVDLSRLDITSLPLASISLSASTQIVKSSQVAIS